MSEHFKWSLSVAVTWAWIENLTKGHFTGRSHCLRQQVTLYYRKDPGGTRLKIRPKKRKEKMKIVQSANFAKWLTRVARLTKLNRVTSSCSLLATVTRTTIPLGWNTRGIVRKTSNMRICQYPVSISLWRWSVADMLAHLKTDSNGQWFVFSSISFEDDMWDNQVWT